MQRFDDSTDRSVQILSMISPSLAGLQTVCLLLRALYPAVPAGSGRQPARRRWFHMTLVADVVLVTDDQGLIAGHSLILEAQTGPCLLDLNMVACEIRRQKPASLISYRADDTLRQLMEIDNLYVYGIGSKLHLRYHDDPDRFNFYLRLNDFDKDARPFSAENEKPLVMVATAHSDLNTFDPPLMRDTQYALVIHPNSRKLQAVCCNPSTAGRVSFNRGPEHTHSIQGQVLLDFYESDTNEVILIDADADASLATTLNQTAVVLGRWSNYQAPSLLFPSAELKEGQRKWYAVNSNQTQSRAKGDLSLQTMLWERLLDERQDADFISEHLRLLPNWLLRSDGGIYLGGAKRLLSFFTDDRSM